MMQSSMIVWKQYWLKEEVIIIYYIDKLCICKVELDWLYIGIILYFM